jgi:predicted Holliday junction resolvase-like endonuclease
MNMTDWKKVTGTQPDKPEEIDRTSSPLTVYLRKNIEQVTREVEGSNGEMATEWQYDEKEMTVEEYENMALMKTIVEENTSGIVESVTQFQRDAVIDEYTQQLIEEGLI